MVLITLDLDGQLMYGQLSINVFLSSFNLQLCVINDAIGNRTTAKKLYHGITITHYNNYWHKSACLCVPKLNDYALYKILHYIMHKIAKVMDFLEFV